MSFNPRTETIQTKAGLKSLSKRIAKEVLEGMKEHVRLMRLVPGDILVCESKEAMEALGHVKLPEINFHVPLVFAPKGGLRTATREELVEIIESLDATPATEPEDAEIHGAE